MTRARDVANLIGSGNFSSTTFTATAGQTAFTISHTQGFVQVFMNGLLLDETVDYTSNGSAITLTSGAAAGDEIEVVKYNTFSVGNAIPASGGTFTGNVGFGATPTRQVHIAGNPSIMLMEDTGGGTNDKKAQLQVDSGVFEINSRNDDNSSLKDNILTAELDTGNIGIGTNSPTGSVHISSSAPSFYMTDTTNNTEGVVSVDNAGSLVLNADLNNEAASSNVRFLVDGTERMRISAEGRVTKPNQPFIECKGNSNSAHTYSANDVVSHWSNRTTPVGITRSGGRFTVPVAGKYLFCFTLYSYVASASHYRNRVKINGSTHSLTQLEVSSAAMIDTQYDHTLMSSHILNMSANDYVEIIATTGQQFYRGGEHNALSMMLIG